MPDLVIDETKTHMTLAFNGKEFCTCCCEDMASSRISDNFTAYYGDSMEEARAAAEADGVELQEDEAAAEAAA